MAAGFIADTASLPLVASNLVNVVSADFFGIGFNRYASVMAPVNIVSVLATLVVLFLYFRSSIPARYDATQLTTPSKAIRDRATFRAGWGVLVCCWSASSAWSHWCTGQRGGCGGRGDPSCRCGAWARDRH